MGRLRTLWSVAEKMRTRSERSRFQELLASSNPGFTRLCEKVAEAQETATTARHFHRRPCFQVQPGICEGRAVDFLTRIEKQNASAILVPPGQRDARFHEDR